MVKRYRQEIYSDLKAGLLLPDDYEYERKQLLQKQKNYEMELKELNEKERRKADLQDTLREYRTKVLSFESDKIPWDVLDKLIDKITVFSPERIEVTFSFANELQDIIT